MWFSIMPFSIVIAGLLLLCLFIVPVARGHEMGSFVFKDVALSFVATLMVGMLLGWAAWKLIRHTDAVANVVFCLVLVASGVWTTGLTNEQRSRAESMFNDTVGDKLAVVTDKARGMFEVGD